MIYNYHTHTERCGHAHGGDEEFINRAIEAGIKYLGFSDHMPMIFPDGYESSYRVPMSEAESYVSDLRKLREKHRNKIEISIGFEMEYYPLYFDEMLNIARNCGAEYLLLAQHFIGGERPNGKGSIGPTDSEEHLKCYVDEVIAGMKTGVFTYVAHPDLVCFTGDEEIYKREITRLCKASKECGVPLEINMLGIRCKKHYPADKFWQIAGEIGAPVTIGFDAHKSKNLLDKDQLVIAKKIINTYKLNYIGMPKLRMIN